MYKGPNPTRTGFQLNLQSIDELVAMPLRGGDGFAPFFSPDGEWVGFSSNEGGNILQKVSTSGGSPVTLTVSSNPIFGASWGADDRIIFGTGANRDQATGAGLFRVPAGGGEPEQLTVLDRDQDEVYHLWPDHIAGREAVVFVITTGLDPWVDAQLAVLDLRSGRTKRLGLAGSSPQYLPTGHLVYANSNGSVSAVPFDARSLEVTGSPVVLVEGVSVKNSAGTNFSVSDNGRLIYAPAPPPAAPTLRELVWVDRQGNEEPLPMPPQWYSYPRLSPNGRRIAVEVDRRLASPTGSVHNVRASDLWVYDAVAGSGLRLTHDDYRNAVPIWTPDGERIFFSSARDAPRPESFTATWWGNLYAVSADGSSEAERLTTSDESQASTGITPDGKLLLYSRHSGDDGFWEIMAMPADGSAEPTALMPGPFGQGSGTVSPDGQWLAYQTDESGTREIYVEPFPGPGARIPVSIGGGGGPVWSHDSRELFYRASDGMMMAATIVDGVRPEVASRTALFSAAAYLGTPANPRQYHVAPDGRFLMIRDVPTESAPQEIPPPQINVVLNWFEELEERVPGR